MESGGKRRVRARRDSKRTARFPVAQPVAVDAKSGRGALGYAEKKTRNSSCARPDRDDMAISTKFSKSGVCFLLGSLGVVAAQAAACSAPFRTCQTNRTCRVEPKDDAGASGDDSGGGRDDSPASSGASGSGGNPHGGNAPSSGGHSGDDSAAGQAGTAIGSGGTMSDGGVLNQAGDAGAALKCDNGYNLCGSSCVKNSVQSCGASCSECTAPANATAKCDGTSCGFTCAAGFTGDSCEYPRMQAMPMPSGYTGATITAMSDDGSVVAGSIGDGSVARAFRWVTSSPTVTVGSVNGQTNARPIAISGDGTRIYGNTDYVPFEWRLNQAPAQMLNLASGTYLSACNTTGLTVVGLISSNSAPDKPLIYDVTSGTASTPTSASYSSAAFLGVSGDGLTAVGWGDSYPIRWTSAGFSELPGGSGIARAISSNGQYAVGNLSTHAALWSGAGLQTVTDLGQLPSLPNWRTEGHDVSEDGKVVAIQAQPPTGGTDMALIWTSAGGLQKLSDALGAAGIDVSEWDLKFARAVSANGKIIAGGGVKGGVSLGFVARMP